MSKKFSISATGVKCYRTFTYKNTHFVFVKSERDVYFKLCIINKK